MVQAKSKIRRREKPATDAQRAAMTFPGVAINFKWTNEEWAATYLPFVRLAMATLQKNEIELQQAMSEMNKAQLIPELLENLCFTKDHLKTLVEMLDAALSRSFLMVERLGYSPHNPPPGDAAGNAWRDGRPN
jgi:hypothetical protein